MSSRPSKMVAAAVGTLALLAFVGRRLEEGPCFPNWQQSGVTAAGHKMRLLRAQAVGNKATMEIDFDPQVVSGVLQKTVFSPSMRMIFLVGLEGTGHHFMANVIKSMCKLEKVSCPNTHPLAVALYSKMGTPKSPADYRVGLERIRHEAETLALHSDRRHNGKVYLLAFGRTTKQTGMMSFPNFRGRDKPLQYVDLRILAEEAERATIDLRLIYMVRPARRILLSDTQHRHFGGGFTHEARILTNNAAVIDSVSRELHPNFTICFSYDKISDPDQALRVARFVTPTEEAATNFSRTLLETVRIKSPTKRRKVGDPEGWDLMAGRLQRKLDEIERSWC